MKIKNKILKAAVSVLLSSAMLLAFVSCATSDTDSTTGATTIASLEDTTVAAESATSSSDDTVSTDTAYPTVPVTGTAVTEYDTAISLNGDTASVTGTGVAVDGSSVTINKPGTYLVSGTLNDGQLIVNSTVEGKKVKIIFNGVNIYNSTSAPFYVMSSPDETVIILNENSVNLLYDSDSYTVPDDATEDYPTAALYSKDDLQIEGNGSLYVTGNYNKGIFSKDDLQLRGGKIYVTAVDDAIRGKDSVEITGNTLINAVAGDDGIRTSNEEDADKGFIYIESGDITINAQLDAIQAITDLTIDGGTFNITCGGGSANSSSSSNSDSWGNWGGGFGGGPQMKPRQGGMSTDAGETDSVIQLSSTAADVAGETQDGTDSAKAVKAGGAISITGGNFTIDSSDDAVHSNDTVTISGGKLDIASGDDGIHADNKLTVSGGDINITKSYEGLEAVEIDITGGTNRVVASDDGVNANGGSDGSAFGRPGENNFGSVTSDSDSLINISGGYLFVNSSGDGVDSNGNITMSAGKLVVFGPTDNGNGSLDYNGSFIISGGELISAGSSGMAQSPTGNGQQVLAFTCSMAADSVLDIRNSSGNSLVSFASPKNYSFVVYSSPSLVAGASYDIYSGSSCTGEVTDYVYSGGTLSDGSKLGSVSIK